MEYISCICTYITCNTYDITLSERNQSKILYNLTYIIYIIISANPPSHLPANPYSKIRLAITKGGDWGNWRKVVKRYKFKKKGTNFWL